MHIECYLGEKSYIYTGILRKYMINTETDDCL